MRAAIIRKIHFALTVTVIRKVRIMKAAALLFIRGYSYSGYHQVSPAVKTGMVDQGVTEAPCQNQNHQ
jgi:hypothetical protein